MYTSATLFVCTGVDALLHRYARSTIISFLIFILGGIACSGAQGIESTAFWITSGLLLGIIAWLLYYFIIRFDVSLIPYVVLMPLIATIIVNGSGSTIGLGILAVGELAHLWTRRLRSE
jgi:hypothetical protein